MFKIEKKIYIYNINYTYILLRIKILIKLAQVIYDEYIKQGSQILAFNNLLGMKTRCHGDERRTFLSIEKRLSTWCILEASLRMSFAKWFATFSKEALPLQIFVALL